MPVVAATTPVKVKKEALKPIDEAKAAADKESAGEKPKEKKGAQTEIAYLMHG
jgi:hypothetical protein